MDVSLECGLAGAKGREAVQEALWCCRASKRGLFCCTPSQKGRSHIVSTCHTCHMGCSGPGETVSRALKAIASRWYGPPCLNLCYRRRRNDPSREIASISELQNELSEFDATRSRSLDIGSIGPLCGLGRNDWTPHHREHINGQQTYVLSIALDVIGPFVFSAQLLPWWRRVVRASSQCRWPYERMGLSGRIHDVSPYRGVRLCNNV